MRTTAFGATVADGRRWVIVALIATALVGLGYLSLDASARSPWVGLSADRDGERLVVRWVQPAGWAWDAGIRPGDVISEIAGRPSTSDDGPVQVADAPWIQVRSASGVLLTAPVTPAPAPDSYPQRLSFLVTAACFLAVGGAAFVLAADVLASSLLLCVATSAAALLMAGIATLSGLGWALATEYVAVVAFGGTTLLLFLVFPINRLSTRPGRWVAAAAVAAHAGLLVGYAYVVTLDTAAYGALQTAWFVVVAADLLGAVVLILLARFATPVQQRAARRALELVCLGSVAGLLPFGLLSLVPHALGLGYLVPPHLAIGSLVLLPTSLGAAILSRQLLGITRLVRRGLIALAVWLALVSAYSLGLNALGRALALRSSIESAPPGWIVVSVALVAGTLPTAQKQLQGVLERILFPDTYSYAETLQQLGAELAHLSGVDAVATHTLARLGRTLDLSWAALALNAAGSPAALHRWGQCPADLDPARLVAAGSPVEGDPDARTTGTIVPLVADRVTIGALAIGPKRHDVVLLAEDRALVATVAHLVATTLQNALLVRQLRTQLAVLGERERTLGALNARLMQVQEDERRTLALDLHDDPLQRALLLARELGEAEEASPQSERWRQAVEDIIVSLRAICVGLRPPALDDFGLAAGLERLVSDLRARSDLATWLRVETADRGPFGRLRSDLETALYRVAQEALNNCARHARATRVAVTLVRDPRTIRLRVVDDGQGYRPAADPGRSRLGIVGMRERLSPWGGVVTVEDGPTGGTVLSAEILLRAEHG